MIYIFGKSQEEILKLIKEDEMRTKMTREEAFKKLKRSVLDRPGTVANDEAINDWLNALEALSLIKFDDPKSILDGRFITIEDLTGETCRGRIKEGLAFESGLKACGYKIVKI